MDIHLQTSPTLHFRGVNGGGANSSSRGSSAEDDCSFLSQEEQEVIAFFEETIDSLEDSLTQEERSGPGPEPEPVQLQLQALESSSRTSGSSPPGPSAVAPMADPRGPRDQDIIDLLQPDLLQNKGPVSDPTVPGGIWNTVRTPDSHVEVRSSRRDLMDSLPSEYNPPLPSSSYGPGPYHPPGSIPTPVLMAQNLAQNQNRAVGGLTDGLLPSDHHHAKQGPPTSTKPISRFPANINVKLDSHNNNNNINQSLASVSIHERRSQMLANLPGACQPMEEQHAAVASSSAPPPERNLPTRSVSFRDPTPDKSRMEALSKLGLTRSRARSGGSTTGPVAPGTPTTSDTTDTGRSAQTPLSQTLIAETRAETAVLPFDPISGPKTIEANPSPPSTVTQSTDKTVAHSTDKTVAQKDDKTVAQRSTDKTVAQRDDKTVAQSTDKTVAQKDDKTVAQRSTDKTVAQRNTEKTVAQNSDKTVAQSSDKTVTQSTDKTVAQSTDKTVAQRSTDKTVAQSTESTDWPPPHISSLKTIKANPSPPSTVAQSTDWAWPPPPPPPESEPTVTPPPPPPEVTSWDFNTSASNNNNNRSLPSVTEAGGHDGLSAHHPSSLAVATTTSDYNSYGGKSKVMTPAPTPVPVIITRSHSDLPDILSSHIDRRRASAPVTSAPMTSAPVTPGRAEMLPYEVVSSYGGKTRSITPTRRGSNPTSHGPATVRTPNKAPQAPSPAPKPLRGQLHPHHGPSSLSTPQKVVGGSPSPDPARRRSVSGFRSQGITVQFSGRGATDASRRDALRKLGLLKDTC